MKKSPKVFIIVLNYNHRDTLRECLQSVFRLHYSNFQVIVADNLSSDGSFELAKKYFEKAHFIQNGKNVGFAAGNNPAIRFALEKFADYILLLNPDATIKEDSLEKMVETAEKEEKNGIVSPLIFLKNFTRPWFAGGKIDWLAIKTDHIQEVSTAEKKVYSTQCLTGCAMLIKKTVFQKIGLFDEDFFLYYEDADFSYRAAKNGFQLLLDTRAEVSHRESSEKNLAQKTYWLVFSGLLFFHKNFPLILRPYFILHTWLRKIKNYFDTKEQKSFSKEIKKAFDDYAVWKKNQSSQS